MTGEKYLLIFERIACICLIGWLQVVGLQTKSIIHHILHALPIAILLFIPKSPTRQFTGFLAGFLWVFMLAVVTSMLHDSLILGFIFTKRHIPYTWLAPVAALIAAMWSAANVTLLLKKPKWVFPNILIGISLIWLLAWAYPYLSRIFEYPVNRATEGQYHWIIVLLFETFLVLAIPSYCAFRLSSELRLSRSFITWQIVYWIVFVVAMVVGLLPPFIRDRF